MLLAILKPRPYTCTLLLINLRNALVILLKINKFGVFPISTFFFFLKSQCTGVRADIFFGRGVPNILGVIFFGRKIGGVIKFLMNKL